MSHNVSKHLMRALLTKAAMLLTVMLLLSGWHSIIAYAQPAGLKEMRTEFIPEAGCPVSVSAARTEIEVDPFGTPLASRIYITYRNDSNKTMAGVRFRVRFVDETGQDRGTLQAPHASVVAPGSTGSEKWRHERVDPRASQLKIRVLMVKFTDGSVWQTSSMPEQTPGTAGPDGGSPVAPAPASVQAGSSK